METKPVKYTEEFVLNELTEMLDNLKKNKEIIFIGELLEDKPYSMQRISEWKEMNDEISETYSRIKDILQTRAAVGGMKKELDASMTKFHLSANYGWKDKSEVDNNVNLNKTSDILKRLNGE